MAHVNAFVQQFGFRIRNDDGDLGSTGATWKANENVNASAPVDEVFRIRIGAEETAGGAANNNSYVLQYNLNGGGWVALATTGAIRSAPSAFVANGTPTTRALSSNTIASFVAGEFDSTSDASNISLSSQFTEMEYSVILDGASIVNGDSIQFRMTDGLTALEGYVNTPTITAIAIASIVLTGSNSLQANTSTTGSVTQQSSVSGSNSLQSNTSTQGAVTQRHTLSGSNSTQANTTTSGAVTFNVNLTGSNSTQANTVNAGAVAQKHNLAGSSSTQASTTNAGAVSQSHVLAGSNSVQANTTTSGSLSSSSSLSASNSIQANTVSSGAVGQTHKLTANNSVQTSTTTAGSTSSDLPLTASNSVQASTSSSGAVLQTHKLTGQSSVQAGTVTGGAVAQSHLIAGANSTQANTTTAGAVSASAQRLTGNSSAQSNTTTSAAVTQKHVLTGSNSKQVNVVTGGEVDQLARVSMKKLRHIYNIAQLHGLDPNTPVSITPQSREAGDTRQTISGDGKSSSAVESQQLSAMSGNAEDWIDALAAIYGITERVEITQSGRTAGFVSQTFTKNGDQMVVSRNA